MQQQEQLGVVSTGYELSGVSVIQGNGSMYAEITYTRPALDVAEAGGLELILPPCYDGQRVSETGTFEGAL